MGLCGAGIEHGVQPTTNSNNAFISVLACTVSNVDFRIFSVEILCLENFRGVLANLLQPLGLDFSDDNVMAACLQSF